MFLGKDRILDFKKEKMAGAVKRKQENKGKRREEILEKEERRIRGKE